MECLSPVPDEIPQQPPQNADCDGSNQEYVILHVVGAATHDLAELCSPLRLTIHLFVFPGLRPGQAFDLVNGLDLYTVPGRALVWEYLNTHRPRCVVVSPPCATFSRLMGICRGRMPLERFEKNNLVGKNIAILRNVRV
jgi:hypothetical protein